MKFLLPLTACCSLLMTAGAAAAYPREPYSIPVSTRGVDFNDKADTAHFYRRLKIAAKTACDSGLERDLGARQSDARCAREALDQAVRQINQPLLTALHTGRGSTQYASAGDR